MKCVTDYIKTLIFIGILLCFAGTVYIVVAGFHYAASEKCTTMWHPWLAVGVLLPSLGIMGTFYLGGGFPTKEVVELPKAKTR